MSIAHWCCTCQILFAWDVVQEEKNIKVGLKMLIIKLYLSSKMRSNFQETYADGNDVCTLEKHFLLFRLG